MGLVNTVTGAVNSEELGITLMHEHFVFGYPGYQGDVRYANYDEPQILDNLCEIVNKLMAHGVNTIVDATPNDCGRNPELYRKISTITGVNIICATGYYNEELGGSAYFKLRSKHYDVEKEIYELFMREITQGIGETDIKAGVIKLATGKHYISEYEKMFFKMAAKVQKECNIPIITHTEEGRLGCEQFDFLVKNEANPSKIMIGHMCDNLNIREHEYILKQGGYVGLDRFSVQNFWGVKKNEERLCMLKELVNKGYIDGIMFSQDFVMKELGREHEKDSTIDMMHIEWPCDCLFEKVIPMMRKIHIRDEEIRKVLIENPKKFLDTNII